MLTQPYIISNLYNHVVKVVNLVKIVCCCLAISMAMPLGAAMSMPPTWASPLGASDSDLSVAALVNLSSSVRPLMGVSFKQGLGDDVSCRIGGEWDLVNSRESRLNMGLLTNGPIYCGVGFGVMPGAISAPYWGEVLAGGRLEYLTGTIGAEFRYGLLSSNTLALTFGGPL